MNPCFLSHSAVLRTAARDKKNREAAGLFVIGVPSLPDLELDADVTSATLEDPAVREVISRLGGIRTDARR